MVVKSSKISPVVTGKQKVKAVVSELIQVFKNEKSSNWSLSTGHTSPRLHLKMTQISQNRGENSDFNEADEVNGDELSIWSDINDSDNISIEPIIILSRNRGNEYPTKLNKVDSELISMSETIDETQFEDASECNTTKFTSASIFEQLSADFSNFSRQRAQRDDRSLKIKSWLKRDVQNCPMSSNKRVKFLLNNEKGEQRIVDPSDESDTESDCDSEDSFSYYRELIYIYVIII